jgi:5-methylcytosine-specific restriction enzyme subunit McrC
VITALADTPRPRLCLREWQPSPPVSLAEPDLRELLSMRGRIEVRPAARGTWSIAAKSFIGRVRLPGLDLEIVPKCPVQNVLQLIAYAQRVPDLFEHVSDAGEGSVADLVVSAFVHGVGELIAKGLRRDYREHEGDLGALRGRLDLARHLRQHHVTRPRLSCRFEDHTLDTPFNAALRHAADRAFTEWPHVQRALFGLRARLQEIPPRVVTPAEIDAFHYDRLTESYAPAHRLCKLVLEGTGVALEHGDAAPAGTFLVDMNKVFEEFVARWLTENLRPPFRVERQAARPLDRERGLTVIPDLLLYEGEHVRAVLDTKYKLRHGGGPSNDDVYQALAYARRFGLRRAWLLFADDDTVPRTATTWDGENEVVSVGLGLAQSWERIESTLRSVVRSACSISSSTL